LTRIELLCIFYATMEKKETDIQKIVKGVRAKAGITQEALGKLIWPGDNPRMAGVRIAKYELGLATPPGDVLLRIMRLRVRVK
jgi:hypothetical protein